MPNYWKHVATEVWFDPFSFLAYAGGISKLRLITDIVVVPYRSPFHTAKAVATLDFMTGGRVIFGAGVGYLEGEFNALRVPFRERGPMTDEYLEIMKVLWTAGQPRYEGKYYRVSDITFWPRPVQQPHPPIWIGGQTAPSVRRAVKYGDGWVPFNLDLPGLERALALFHELWGQQGGPKPGFQIVMRADRANVTRQPLRSAERQPFWGSPEQIAEDIQRYVRAGATYFIAGFQGFELEEHQENMERFAREVMPLFRDP
jgi:probable F420-dependent oxidoreductase